ncbi:MAG: VF530 family DNA-binding protein, partial [Opitutae bacterium]|nr:VF530 family DNA-binding protein [Opitutae bacterium]
GLGGRIEIRCFNENPSVKSSLKFLRKTPWARKKVEDLFIYTLDKYGTDDAETTALSGKDK